MIAGLPLTKRVLTPVAKIFFLPFELSARMSTADAFVQKKL